MCVCVCVCVCVYVCGWGGGLCGFVDIRGVGGFVYSNICVHVSAYSLLFAHKSPLVTMSDILRVHIV